MKAIVLLSGGMDSGTLLAHAIDQDVEVVRCLAFTYGSKHNPYENRAAMALVDYYRRKLEFKHDEGFRFQLINLQDVMAGFKSNLLMEGGDIPEGHYEADSMSQTVVPGRNMIFATVAAGLAWSMGASEVYMGIHAGDHHIYPDCRPEFFHAMNTAVTLGTDGHVELAAPFLHGNKTSIIKRGLELEVPYVLTRTCYKNQPVACGKCGSCQERLEAFANNGVEDLIEYESRELLPK